MTAFSRGARDRARRKRRCERALLAIAAVLSAAACSDPGPSGRPARASAAPPAAGTARPAAAAADVVPPGAAGQPFAASRAYAALDQGPPVQAWFVCDGVDAPEAVVVGLPDPSSRLGLVVLGKAPGAAAVRRSFTLGRPDPGAGQIHWPLADASGREAGVLHAFNPGALGDPRAAYTPTFTSLRLDGREIACRWSERTRLLGVSAERSLLVTQAPDGTLTYREFDFRDAAAAVPTQGPGADRSTAASLEVPGGEETVGGFIFHGPGGRSYAVSATAAGAAVTRVDDQGRITREPVLAYVLGAGPLSTGPGPVRGPRAPG